MAKPKTKTPAAAEGREYLVLTTIDKAGDIYPPGSAIVLTDDEAAHPLQVGAVKPKEAE